ncbi:MAG TPA: ImmA/IrrE family metallo-endopeptidase [Candidatus Kapabacteria bacterium]|nr:ImmA/IrrE family metallo-endopeptidase [Candidatus Kapabacteria bacterium]
MEKNAVTDQADIVRKEYNPDGVSPFPYEKIEQLRGDIAMYAVDLDEDLSGAIHYEKDGDFFTIFVNQKKSPARQHFTMAHALGHYFLHEEILKKEEVLIDDEASLAGNVSGSVPSREYEANIFAANLLMPKELVAKAWNELGSVEACARIFQVSITAMSIRLTDLGFLE